VGKKWTDRDPSSYQASHPRVPFASDTVKLLPRRRWSCYHIRSRGELSIDLFLSILQFGTSAIVKF
jgi:hypothetical protein